MLCPSEAVPLDLCTASCGNTAPYRFCRLLIITHPTPTLASYCLSPSLHSPKLSAHLFVYSSYYPGIPRQCKFCETQASVSCCVWVLYKYCWKLKKVTKDGRTEGKREVRREDHGSNPDFNKPGKFL
jgi:hypothetical protein